MQNKHFYGCLNTVRLFLPILILLAGCSQQVALPPASSSPSTLALSPTNIPPQTLIPTPTAPAPAATLVPTVSPPPTQVPSLTPTLSPTDTSTPEISPTPTSQFITGQILMRAFCRYGPGQAYLYSHELKQDDLVELHGRNATKTWLWVRPPNLNRDCWVSASLVQVTGEISSLPVFTSRLPHSTLYGPPKEVQAVRDGNTVKVAWSRVWMTEDDDRGYLIQASICQAGSLVTVAVHTEDNSYEFNDDQNCSSASGGKLYTVEKHGYTDPVEIPWP